MQQQTTNTGERMTLRFRILRHSEVLMKCPGFPSEWWGRGERGEAEQNGPRVENCWSWGMDSLVSLSYSFCFIWFFFLIKIKKKKLCSNPTKQLKAEIAYLIRFVLQFSSVAQSCPTVCNPMDCSTPGLPVHHQLPGLLKLMSIESVMPSNHFILCHPLLLSPSIFPSSRVFSKESVLHIRWPKHWSLSFSISPSNEYPVLIY